MEKINRQLNYAFESLVAIGRKVAGNKPDTEPGELRDIRLDLEKYSEKYPGTEGSRDTLLEIYDYITENVSVEDDFIRRCFTQLPDDGSSIAEYVMLLDNMADADKKLGMTNGELFMVITLAQNEIIEDDNIPIAKRYCELGEYTRMLSRSDLPDESKFTYISAASMYEEYEKRIHEIIASVEARLREKYSLIAPTVEAFCDEMDANIRNAGSIKRCLSDVGLTLDCEKITLRPSLMCFNGIRTLLSTTLLKALGSNVKDEMDLCYGIYFNLGYHGETLEENVTLTTLKQLKALDDANRFDIMCALAKDGLCGADLARLTGVTPATISHHMNELASSGLITIEKQGAKFVYSTNKEAMKRLLKNMEMKLL